MADAARYHRLQRRLSLLGFVVSAAYLLALLFTPEGRVFARWSAGSAESPWPRVGLLTVELVGLHTAPASRRSACSSPTSRRPVAEEPHRERRGRGTGPDASDRALRHVALRLSAGGDRIGARPRARAPRPRRRAPRPAGQWCRESRHVLAGRARPRRWGTVVRPRRPRRPRRAAVARARPGGAGPRPASARDRKSVV